MSEINEDFVAQIVQRNRYLTLATTDGTDPWIAPVEYIHDADLNLYFFSPADSRHSQQLGANASVAVAIYDAVQPEFEPAPTIVLAGLQIAAKAKKLDAPFPALVQSQIETWGLPMPPYAAYRITPVRWFAPAIKDGVNQRIEIQVG